MAYGEWVGVESSNIAEIRHDPENNLLQIRFLSEAVYEYENVPEDMYEEMLMAPSKGKWFWRNMREFPDDFPYTRIE